VGRVVVPERGLVASNSSSDAINAHSRMAHLDPSASSVTSVEPTASVVSRPDDAGRAAAESAERRRLGDDLQALVDDAAGKPISLGRMIEVLGDRGHAVLIIILTAPFLVLPIPGISTAFGAAIFALGACVMLGIRPWLPRFIAKRQLSSEKLSRLVAGVERVLRKVEKVCRPRMLWLTHKAWHWLIGFSLCAAAVALALPIPIPWNNVPPAFVLMLLAFGLLERDGVLLVAGHIANIALWIAIYFMGDFLIDMIQKAWNTVF
jgi:hypothetical protein